MKCFICNGAYLARKCPIHQRLAATLTTEENKQREAAQMSSIQILNSMESLAGPKKNGLMYILISIEGHKLNILVDTGASNVFILEEVVTKLDLKLKKNKV